MKKTTTKLQFKKHTIRILQSNELNDVAGAAPTALCTQQATGCSKTAEGCPASNAQRPGHHGCQSGLGYGCDWP